MQFKKDDTNQYLYIAKKHMMYKIDLMNSKNIAISIFKEEILDAQVGNEGFIFLLFD